MLHPGKGAILLVRPGAHLQHPEMLGAALTPRLTRRRDVIQALCGLLGVGTLATRRVRAAAPRQILLARLHVAGTAYYDAEAAADRLRPGQRLALRRQPENRYDALAIEVLGPEGHKLGYVPRRRNEMPARLMDAGKRLSARTESIRAARQLAEHPGLAVPGRCLNRPVDGAPGPRRTQAVRCPSPRATRGRQTGTGGRAVRPRPAEQVPDPATPALARASCAARAPAPRAPALQLDGVSRR